MSIVLIVLYYCVFERVTPVQALPFNKDCPTPTSSNCDDCRTTLDIIWSCLVTVFACTWVAIHPNIPAAEETWFAVGRRRTLIMVVALIAPELLLLWAMEQWSAARKLAQKYRSEGWTLTHGHFAIMGGFVTEGDNALPHTLKEDEFNELILNGNIVLPKITKREIDDRSKGDVISKGFMIVQMGWFTFQCIARGIEHLLITPLEISTLAFAVVNLTTYIFWWSKPLNVQCAIPVPIVKPIVKKTRNGEIQNPYIRRRISTFHSGTGSFIAIVAVVSTSIIFGAIHCLAWSFQFPSHRTEVMWRMCALAITFIPAFLTISLPIFFCISMIDFPCIPQLYTSLFTVSGLCLPMFLTAYCVFGAACIVYVLARVTILVEVFILLRSLPTEAFQTVKWTTFIPHV